MIYDLVPEDDMMLRTACNKFNFDTMDAKALAVNLGETMIAKRGVGLAAPQCGINAQAFVVGNPEDKDSIMGFFNPKIVDFFGERVYYEEGCLSFPGLFIKVKRHAGIRLRFTDMNGETTTTKYTGMTARVIQHEFDHLFGMTMLKRGNKIHVDAAKRKLKKLIRLKTKVNK